MKWTLVALLVGAALTAESRNSFERFEFEQPLMGTRARIVLYARDAAAANDLASRAFERIADLDRTLSDYRDDSELMQLCRRAGGSAARVSDDLFRVIEAAQTISRKTDGAFDVTIGPVSRLWRRARVLSQTPDPRELADAQKLVGYQNVVLSPEEKSVRLLKQGMVLDLGGIGKGYAADEALKVLRANGASASLVALGGDIVAGDAPPGKAGWQVAVAPLGLRGMEEFDRKALANGAVSTSGDAEQFLEDKGTRYSHLLDPASGTPRTGRRGVTVIAPDGATADALATAAAVMGAERGLKLIESFPGVAALFVEMQGGTPREQRSTRW